jgi:hypothetical protein
VMPQAWGSDKEMRSVLLSGDPTSRSGRPGSRARPLGMRGGGHEVDGEVEVG